MEFAMELWKPILISGLGVFAMSALVWTVMPHHKKEWRKIPNEDAVADALRASDLAPGLYNIPHMDQMSDMGTPEGMGKMNRGPIAYMTIVRNGVPEMGPYMLKSALCSLVVAFFVGYLAWHAIPAGADYLDVFRITGTVTFMTYGLGTMGDSIWFGRPWGSWALGVFDALLYAGVTGGVFGWLWA